MTERAVGPDEVGAHRDVAPAEDPQALLLRDGATAVTARACSSASTGRNAVPTDVGAGARAAG